MGGYGGREGRGSTGGLLCATAPMINVTPDNRRIQRILDEKHDGVCCLSQCVKKNDVDIWGMLVQSAEAMVLVTVSDRQRRRWYVRCAGICVALLPSG